MGRPTKFTPERVKRIIDALSVGNTRTCAVAHAGIDYQSFLNWLERGQGTKKGDYFEFFESVKKAEADAEFANVVLIRKAAVENWQAAAWWLERRRHQDWMKREHTDGTQTVIIKHAYDDEQPCSVPSNTPPGDLMSGSVKSLLAARNGGSSGPAGAAAKP